MSEREDVEALLEVLWTGKYDNRTRTWDWCGCVAPASEHFARGFCPLFRKLAAHVEAVRVSERVRLAGEVEALAREVSSPCWLGNDEIAAKIRALTPGVRLTEEE